jgi:hypothetical protein
MTDFSPGQPTLKVGQQELNGALMLNGDRSKGIPMAAAIYRTADRVLVGAAVALAALLLFGLLSGGLNAGAQIPSQHLLPAVPEVHSLHPHGPNRPLRRGCRERAAEGPYRRTPNRGDNARPALGCLASRNWAGKVVR